MIRTEKDLRSGMNLILCLFRVCLSKKEERFQSLRLVGKARVSRKQGAPRESSGFQFPFFLFLCLFRVCLRKKEDRFQSLRLVGKARVSRKQGAPRESSGFQFPFCSVLQWCLRKPKYKVRMKKVFLELE